MAQPEWHNPDDGSDSVEMTVRISTYDANILMSDATDRIRSECEPTKMHEHFAAAIETVLALVDDHDASPGRWADMISHAAQLEEAARHLKMYAIHGHQLAGGSGAQAGAALKKSSSQVARLRDQATVQYVPAPPGPPPEQFLLPLEPDLIEFNKERKHEEKMSKYNTPSRSIGSVTTGNVVSFGGKGTRRATSQAGGDSINSPGSLSMWRTNDGRKIFTTDQAEITINGEVIVLTEVGQVIDTQGYRIWATETGLRAEEQ